MISRHAKINDKTKYNIHTCWFSINSPAINFQLIPSSVLLYYTDTINDHDISCKREMIFSKFHLIFADLFVPQFE